MTADEYLAHRYEGELPELPLADENFVRLWEIWLNPEGVSFSDETPPSCVRDIFSDADMDCWLAATSAGRIPVVYARARENFQRTAEALYPGGFASGIPTSVNAFTIKAKDPSLEGHRVILLNKAGYSGLGTKALAGMDITEEEWLEKSAILRQSHEACHYFSLRVLGGMRNHVLDEIAADCMGQLAAFGSFSAPLQKIFFGISEGKVLPGGRFSFYVKELGEEAINDVLKETESALSELDNLLSRNPVMALEPNRPRLALNILTAGIKGIGCLKHGGTGRMPSVRMIGTFPAEMTEIENIYGLIEKALRGESADAALVNLFKMAADEVFSNIVNYGFGDFKTGASVSVLLEGKKDVLSMTFRDNGKPFNPLTLPTPDTSLSVEERPAGGLGIHILKNSFDEVSYSFENGFNVLTLKKCVRGRGPK